VDSPAYADLDWQALSKEIEFPSNAGEDIAAHVTPETPGIVEEPLKADLPEVTQEPEATEEPQEPEA